ncbi:MAG: hypothetical protein WA268_12710 [Xanthobacteraceae bacterium]
MTALRWIEIGNTAETPEFKPGSGSGFETPPDTLMCARIAARVPGQKNAGSSIAENVNWALIERATVNGGAGAPDCFDAE